MKPPPVHAYDLHKNPEVTMTEVLIPARQGRAVRVPRGAAIDVQVHHPDLGAGHDG